MADNAENFADRARLSPEEQVAAEKEALSAALAALAPIRDDILLDGDVRERAVATHAVLAAFAAVTAIQTRENQRLRQIQPGKRWETVDLDAHHIVATALAFIDAESPEKADPYSKAGHYILLFANACRALEAYETVITAIHDDGGLFGGLNAGDLMRLQAQGVENTEPVGSSAPQIDPDKA
jgi:hypothetical protein